MANRPTAEIDIDLPFVRSLLQQQFPNLADLGIRELSRGWDNTNFRLGADLIVRVPHRKAAAPLVLSEQRWLPQLSKQLDIAIPAPTHVGQPTADYPWHWSITPWFPGTEAAQAQLVDPASTAEVLGRFYAQLHVDAPVDAPVNPYRGVPVADRSEAFVRRLALLGDTYDIATIRTRFEIACAVPPSTERLWLHGDLHGRNMIVDDGQLSAVIDWGDICAGDRATDLAGAFMLVPNHLDIVQRHSATSDADWARARGWALSFAVIYLAHSDDDPVMGAMGVRLLANALESP